MSEERNEERLRELLGQSFPAGDAPDALRQRVAAMAAKEGARRPARHRGMPTRLVLAFALVLLVGGALALKYLLNRPGETAVQLIPADALLVVSVDTNPSPAQVPLYARIEQAMQNRGVAGKAEQAIGKMVDESGIAQSLRPYIGHNLAGAVLKSGGAPKELFDNFVLLLELKDAAHAEAALKEHGRRMTIGSLTYYRLGKEKICVTEIGPYLVVAQSPELLGRVAQVADGSQPSVATLPEYRTARAELPEDANLMLFVSPSALSEVDKESKAIGMNPLRNTKWMAAAATLRDEGVQIDFRVPMDGLSKPGYNSTPAPLDEKLLHRLPSGAYGLVALSQPSWYWSSMDEKEKHGAREGVGEVEKQFGMSVERDLVPGLGGDAVLAVYPAAPGRDASIDGLVVFSDAHGADPAALAAKVRGAIEKATTDDGKPGVRFHSKPNGVWQLDGHTSKELGKTVHDTLGADSPHDPPFDLLHAQVGKSVLVASSQAMLDRAIAAWSGGGLTMADDPAYPMIRDKMVREAQGLMIVEMHAILERLRPNITKGTSKGDPEDVIRLFGGDGSALVMSGHFDGQVQRGTLFVPLEYERVVNLLSSSAGGLDPVSFFGANKEEAGAK